MKMFARVTAQGTAMWETARCKRDLTDSNKRHHAQPVYADSADGEISKDWQDCTGNEALSCQVCGRGA